MSILGTTEGRKTARDDRSPRREDDDKRTILAFSSNKLQAKEFPKILLTKIAIGTTAAERARTSDWNASSLDLGKNWCLVKRQLEKELQEMQSKQATISTSRERKYIIVENTQDRQTTTNVRRSNAK